MASARPSIDSEIVVLSSLLRELSLNHSEADDLVEAFGRQGRAKVVVGDLGCCLGGGFQDTLHLADRRQAWPLLIFHQPRDVGETVAAGAIPCLDGHNQLPKIILGVMPIGVAPQYFVDVFIAAHYQESRKSKVHRRN